MYKISVIIPTYNAEKYLLNAVDSVINQTLGFEKIELILIDDNSNDNTKEIIKDLSIKYDNIIPIYLDDNSGSASKPRNVGINKASSEYIMFLDNDDFYYPNLCEKLYNSIKNENVDVVCCRYKFFNNDKVSYPNSFLDESSSKIKIDSINDFPDLMTLGFPTMIWTKLFKKKVIINNNITFPEGDLYEDVYFSANFYLNAHGIVVLNDFWGYGYQVRTETNSISTSQNFTENLVKKQMNGFLKIMDMIENRKNFSYLKNELIVDMTKIYLFSKLDIDTSKQILKKIKPFYKSYKINSKIHTAPSLVNILINISIKIFSISIYVPIIVSRLIFNDKFLNLFSKIR